MREEGGCVPDGLLLGVGTMSQVSKYGSILPYSETNPLVFCKHVWCSGEAKWQDFELESLSLEGKFMKHLHSQAMET